METPAPSVRRSSLSCGDKGYYDKTLSSYVYPGIYALWAHREQLSYRPYTLKHQDTKQLLRRILVDYLAEFCEKNRVSTQSRALAICLFDYFDSATLLANLSLSYAYNRELLCADHAVLLMQACLLVAAKVEDIHYNVPNTTDFRNVTMQDNAVTSYLLSCNFPIKQGTAAFESVVSRLKMPKFPLENYRETELRILRQFDWSINIPTIAAFLNAYITELNLLQKAQPLSALSAYLPLFKRELVTHAEYLAELALQRPELLYSDLPSYVAAACMKGAYSINATNNWTLPNSLWFVRGTNLVHRTITELHAMMNSSIHRVAPHVVLDSPRFAQLVSAVLTSHNENQGEKLPATPPPETPAPPQQPMQMAYQQSPATVPSHQPTASCRGSRAVKHLRSQLQTQQRQHPYTATATTSSMSTYGTTVPTTTVTTNNASLSATISGFHSILEQLTPPETPPVSAPTPKAAVNTVYRNGRNIFVFPK